MALRAWDVCLRSLLLVLYGAAVGVAVDYSAFCDTSSNSPTKADLVDANAILTAQYDNGFVNCCQDNDWGSKCTTLGTSGSASISWCNDNSSIKCEDCRVLQSCIQELLVDRCTQSFDGVERVGGWLEVSNGGESMGNILMLRN